jgi:hypothetical protein
MRRLNGANNVQKQSRLLGYRPGEPGDDKVPCVVNRIGFADPHTEHNKYILSVMRAISFLENVNKEFKLTLWSNFRISINALPIHIHTRLTLTVTHTKYL